MAPSAKVSPKNISTIEDQQNEEKEAKFNVDTLFEGLGSFGRFQKIQFLLICIPIAFVQMHVMSWTFVVAPARKICDLNTTTFNDCIEEAYSASDRWNMDGDNSWIRATVQSLYFIGQMIGSFSCGVMADKIGRKRVFYLCVVVQVTCAIGLIFAPTWWLYSLLKTGTGFTQPGIFGVAVVLGIELVGKKYRSLISVIANMFSALGAVILAILAYFLLDYRHLHAAIAIPSLIFLSYWWIIYESARWLVSKGKYGEANNVLIATANRNRKHVPTNWMECVDKSMDGSSSRKPDSFGVVDLVRTPQMRKRTLANFFMWPVTTMMYYGLTMKSDIGGGNIFVTFITSSLVELPAVLIVILLIDRLGRKMLFSTTIFCAGMLLLINWLTHDILPNTFAQILPQIAKGCVTAAYTTMYTYTAELFPTVIRNTAVGCCSTIARFGAILASFIAFFLVEKFGRIVMIVPYSILAITASIVAWISLPETMNKKLPDSISEVEGHTI